MATTIICDRCGTVFQYPPKFKNQARTEIKRIGDTIGPFAPDVSRIDLCPDCTDSLEEWFKEGKQK